MLRGRKAVALRQEGLLTREETVAPPGAWRTDKVEFIVGDALALPFRSAISPPWPRSTSTRCRFRSTPPGSEPRGPGKGCPFVLSDPFSWSTEAAKEEEWLGGKDTGPYAGRGIDNIIALLKGNGCCCPPGASRGRGTSGGKFGPMRTILS